MKQPRNPIDQFIDQIGGTAKVARALGVTASTVSYWRSAGSVPRWRKPSVDPLAKEAGVSWPEEMA